MKVAGPRMHLIVAVSENMGIGKDNALPWRLKSEMKYFAQMTRTTVDPNKKESGCSFITRTRGTCTVEDRKSYNFLKYNLPLFFAVRVHLLKCMPESWFLFICF
jgi:dihydrofolate reductase